MDESGSHMITPTPLETWCCEARARLRPGVPRFRWPPRVASRLAPPLLVVPLLDRCHECDMLHQGITNKSSCMGDCRHHRQHCATGQLHRLKGSAHQGAKTPEGPHAVTSRIMPPWLCQASACRTAPHEPRGRAHRFDTSRGPRRYRAGSQGCGGLTSVTEACCVTRTHRYMPLFPRIRNDP